MCDVSEIFTVSEASLINRRIANETLLNIHPLKCTPRKMYFAPLAARFLICVQLYSKNRDARGAAYRRPTNDHDDDDRR